MLNQGQTNRLLGYPPDARLLIINADDFGMCQADFDFFTSPEAQELVKKEGITLLDYRTLQTVWKGT